MVKRLGRGLAVGAAFGACQAVAAAIVALLVLTGQMHMVVSPVSPATLWLSACTVAASALLGGLLAVLGGQRLDRRPGLLIHVLPAPFVALALASASFPVVQAAGVGLAWLFYLALAALGRSSPRKTAIGALSALLLGLWATLSLERAPTPPEGVAAGGAPNVLWVVFDTVRADHLSTYGYKSRDTSPNLTRLAHEGVLFERAYATATWTLPSHASMLTGTWPSRNGCDDQRLSLDARLPTVAELLARSGWATGLFSSNPWVGEGTGLARGFGVSVPAWSAALASNWFPVAAVIGAWIEQDKGASTVDDRLAAWLHGLPADRPFFAFVNYLEAHDPYHEIAEVDRAAFVPDAERRAAKTASIRHNRFLFSAPAGPGPSPTELQALTSLYDAGIRSDDRHLGALLDLLQQAGRLDNTLIIVVGDHGESLGEGGRYGHHLQPAEEVLHVPLLLRHPGHLPAGTRVSSPVSLIDLLPTVLESAGLSAEIPPSATGRSLVPLARGQTEADAPLFAEGLPFSSPVEDRRVTALGYDPDLYRWWTVQLGALRLARGPWGERLQDTLTDPVGERDLGAELPEARAALGALLDGFEREPQAPGEAPTMDEATRARLRELGYLE